MSGAETSGASDSTYRAYLRQLKRADERTRTADLLITSELLYLLSYVGLLRLVSISQGVRGVILLLDRPHFCRALELAATIA